MSKNRTNYSHLGRNSRTGRDSVVNVSESESSTFRGNRQHPIDSLEATLARDIKIFKQSKTKDLKDRLLNREALVPPSIEENELTGTYSSRWVDENISPERTKGIDDDNEAGIDESTKKKTSSAKNGVKKEVYLKQSVQLKREKQKKSALVKKNDANENQKVGTSNRNTTSKPVTKAEPDQPSVASEPIDTTSNKMTSKTGLIPVKTDRKPMYFSNKQPPVPDVPPKQPNSKYSKIGSSLEGYFRSEPMNRHVSKVQMSVHQVLLLDPSNLFQRFAPSQEDLEAEYTRSVFRTGELSYFLGKLTSRDLGLSSVPKCIVDSGIYLWLADIMQSMTKVNEMHLQLPVTQFKNRANLNVQAIPLKRTKKEFMSIIHSGKLPNPIIMDTSLISESKNTRQTSEDEITIDITSILENCLVQKQAQLLLWIRIDPSIKHSPSVKTSFPVLYCVKSNSK